MGLAALVVRGMLRRPSVAVSPTVTFCSVHTHKVAKKRDAATSLLQRLPFSHGAAQRRLHRW